VAVARAAFESGPWPRMSPAERADIVLRMADGIGEHAVALRYLSAAECGATVPVAEAFATSGVSLLRHYAGAVASYRTTEEVVGLFSRAELRRVPLGVCGVIVPWNSPLSIALFSVAPALASGCSVVVKSPAETPLATYLLGDVATAAGLPPGVLNIVSADREVSETLVRNPEVDAVVFTGSTAVGRRVGSICGGRLAGMTLELGGKSAAIVLDDCDPAVVAQSLAPLTMLHNGQLCNNPTRVLLPRPRPWLLHRADALRPRRQPAADRPRGGFRAGRRHHRLQRRGGGTADRQPLRLRPVRERLVARRDACPFRSAQGAVRQRRDQR
jgi:aldehyde dehydrogenase (NAD+)